MSAIVHDLRDQAMQRMAATIALLNLQCRIYAELAPHVARRLNDDHRRQLVRAADDLGWDVAADYAILATCETFASGRGI
jgi:hypothetical protein